MSSLSHDQALKSQGSLQEHRFLFQSRETCRSLSKAGSHCHSRIGTGRHLLALKLLAYKLVRDIPSVCVSDASATDRKRGHI